MLDTNVNSKIAQLGDCEATVTAGIDAAKRFQFHIDVQTQAMIATSFSNAQTKCRNLCLLDVNTRSASTGMRDDAVAFSKSIIDCSINATSP